MIQIKDMFQIVATWLQFSTEDIKKRPLPFAMRLTSLSFPSFLAHMASLRLMYIMTLVSLRC